MSASFTVSTLASFMRNEGMAIGVRGNLLIIIIALVIIPFGSGVKMPLRQKNDTHQIAAVLLFAESFANVWWN